MADKDAQEANQTAAASVQEMRTKIAELDGKIARLVDLFVEQDIERGEYLSRKRELMSQKRSAEEVILGLERDATAWLEPMREWINEAQALAEIAQSENDPSKKSSLQKVFGSNLTLTAREARGAAQNQWLYLAQAKQDFPKMGLISTVVDLRGVEPRTRQCECRVIPLYYRPVRAILSQHLVGPPGIDSGRTLRVLGQKCCFALFRAAGNRTRSTSTPWTRTTGILRPACPEYTRGVWVMPPVGPPGIEPGPYEPESHVLPAYSGPAQDTSRVRSKGFEPLTFRV